MDLHQALITRRTVQRFVPGAVPDDVMDRALTAATFAPNHKLTWPWRFTLPGGEAREALCALNLKLKSAQRSPTPELARALRAKMLDPDRLLVVRQVLAGDPGREQEDYATCACAIQNLSLSLHADGFHSKWSTGKVTTHPRTYEILRIDATQERIVGFVWIGHAA
nr:nitroreductase [Myxococcales bacterium]